MTIGGWVSSAGGIHKSIHRADNEGFENAMFFIRSPHSWNLPTLSHEDKDKFDSVLKDSSVVKTYAHSLYLANLGTADTAIFSKSVNALATTLRNVEMLEMDGLVFHLGSHRNTTVTDGLDRVIEGMTKILNRVSGDSQLIMENSTQQGDKIGTTLEQIGYVIEALNSPRVKVCLDICHGYASGYDYANADGFSRYLEDIQAHIGIENLICFHVNDSKGELGSGVDRHANIGEGNIGLAGFEKIINEPLFQNKDFILEVPGVNGNGPSQADKEILENLIRNS